MAKIPYILPTQQIQGPIPQQQASDEDFVPNVRQIRQSMEGSSEALGRYGAALEARDKGVGDIGKGISDVGDMLTQRAEAQDLSDLATNVNTVHANLAIQLEAAKKSANPKDYRTFASSFMSSMDGAFEPLQDSATTFKGQQYLQKAISESRSHFAVSAFDTQSNLASEHAVNNYKVSLDSLSTSVVTNPSLFEDAANKLAGTVAALSGANGMSTATGEKLYLEGMKQLSMSTLKGYNNINPQYVQSMMTKGSDDEKDFAKFAPYINGEEKAELIGGARQSVERQERLARLNKEDVDKKTEEAHRNLFSSIYNDIGHSGDPMKSFMAAFDVRNEYDSVSKRDGLQPHEFAFLQGEALRIASGKAEPLEDPAAKNAMIAKLLGNTAVDPNVASAMKEEINQGTLAHSWNLQTRDKFLSLLDDKNIQSNPQVRQLQRYAQDAMMANTPPGMMPDDKRAAAVAASNDFMLHVLPDIQQDLKSGKSAAEIFDSLKGPYYKQVEDFYPTLRQAIEDKVKKEAMAPATPEAPGLMGRAWKSLVDGLSTVGTGLGSGIEYPKGKLTGKQLETWKQKRRDEEDAVTQRLQKLQPAPVGLPLESDGYRKVKTFHFPEPKPGAKVDTTNADDALKPFLGTPQP